MLLKRINSALTVFICAALVACLVPAGAFGGQAYAYADDGADVSALAAAQAASINATGGVMGSAGTNDGEGGQASSTNSRAASALDSSTFTIQSSGISTLAVAVPKAKRNGIDVSQFQGAVDWAQVKASGITFAILRIGNYSSSTRSHTMDTRFLENVKGAIANGIDLGVYIYSYALTDAEALRETQNTLKFLQEAGLTPDKLALPVFYDMEDSAQGNLGAATLSKFATTFCSTVEAAGYMPGVYANSSWWTNKLTASAFSTNGWHKWVAQYNDQISEPYFQGKTVEGTEIWQYASNGQVGGISGNVDVNYDFMGADYWAGCKAAVANATNDDYITMLRLYNRTSGEHLYTSDKVELRDLVIRGWVYEGIGWYAPKSGDTVYRLYNPNSGDHLFTTDKNEYDTLAKIGWRQEGVGFYSDPDKEVAVYRQFNPNAKVGTHNYTTDKNENDTLVKLGWKGEGAAWYGLDISKLSSSSSSSSSSS